MKIKNSDINKINRGFMIIYRRIRDWELKALSKKQKLKIAEKEFFYLAYISDYQELPLAKISKILKISKSAFSIAVSSMVRKGLIKKYHHVDNKKTVFLKLTSKGKSIMKIHNQVRLDIFDELNKILTSEELNKLIDIGEKVLEKL